MPNPTDKNLKEMRSVLENQAGIDGKPREPIHCAILALLRVFEVMVGKKKRCRCPIYMAWCDCGSIGHNDYRASMLAKLREMRKDL